jgi:hypothetical protein
MYNGIEGDLNLSTVKRSDFNRYGIYLVTLRSRIVISKSSVVVEDPDLFRIGSDSYHFAGSGLESASRACRSGPVSIPITSIFDFRFFHENLSKILEIMPRL